MNFGK